VTRLYDVAEINDVIVVGAGVMGLWTARACARAGLKVVLIETSGIAAGASGTPLGALMPHLPTGRANELAAFQARGLKTLPGLISELEAATGLPCGFRRSGRLIPIRTQRFRAKAEAAVAHAPVAWGTDFACEIDDTMRTASLDGWLADDAVAFGLLRETFTAVVEPQMLLAALSKDLQAAGGRIETADFARWDAVRRCALDRHGDRIAAASNLVVCAGHRTFALLEDQRFADQPQTHAPGVAGGGVKGHAVRLELPGHAPAASREGRPLIFDAGIYVAMTSQDSIAVGSTTEPDWTTLDNDPVICANLVERAKALCPALADAKLGACWAGIRPRAASRKPLIGCVDADAGVHVATGGYKISFAIAHLAAEALAATLSGSSHCSGRPSVPDAFQPTPY